MFCVFRFCRSCPYCYKQDHKNDRFFIDGIREGVKRKLCSELGIDFERDPVDFVLGSTELGKPEKPLPRSEDFGQCLFSSIYYLLTGKKSGSFW